MGLDFGGFGKEYAVDQVVELAREFELLTCWSISGDLGDPGFAPRFPTLAGGIEDPNQPGHAKYAVRANDLAVATSGNYLRFFEVDGKRFGHLLDHRTGYPTSNNHMAATVISHSCLEAGILATCSLIDERMQGLALIENHFGSEGCVWSKSGLLGASDLIFTCSPNNLEA